MSSSKANGTYDVVIIGAGVAGSACARFLAEGGAAASRSWTAAHRARRRPLGQRRAAQGRSTTHASPLRCRRSCAARGTRSSCRRRAGRTRLSLGKDNPVLGVDMRHLGARLRESHEAGATILEETEVTGIELVRWAPPRGSPRTVARSPRSVRRRERAAGRTCARPVFPTTGPANPRGAPLPRAAQEVRRPAGTTMAHGGRLRRTNRVGTGGRLCRAPVRKGATAVVQRSASETEGREVALLAGGRAGLGNERRPA